MNIGKALRYYREKSEYSQEDVAYLLGIKRQTYNHYETGYRLPDIVKLCKIADILHITVNDIVEYAKK